MKILDRLNNFVLAIKFCKVTKQFRAKDDLFGLSFDENWLYSKRGNSFYSFHNIKDHLNGGIQISLNWFIRPPDESKDHDQAILEFIRIQEKEPVNVLTVPLSHYTAVTFSQKYQDSNLDFQYWYVYHNRILMIITYMIFEEDTDDSKKRWRQRIEAILNTLQINFDNFNRARMR